jgi:hypothetical protein
LSILTCKTLTPFCLILTFFVFLLRVWDAMMGIAGLIYHGDDGIFSFNRGWSSHVEHTRRRRLVIVETKSRLQFSWSLRFLQTFCFFEQLIQQFSCEFADGVRAFYQDMVLAETKCISGMKAGNCSKQTESAILRYPSLLKSKAVLS